MAEIIKKMLAAIEQDLQSKIEHERNDQNSELIAMMRYHMGWEGEMAGATGKRLRPLFTLLSTQALTSPGLSPDHWVNALHAASAIELLHNFSLIHDDIEDNSDTRRGRKTIWKIYGIPQAINTGDAMFSIAHHAMYSLLDNFPAEIVARVSEQLLRTSIDLTNGQHLDMKYESQEDLQVSDYWPMISGKTAALLSACAKIGAILSGTNETTIQRMAEFGKYLGLAFQVQDDILGIWGKEEKTGKSVASDILAHKKSYPILLSLGKRGEFFEAWQNMTFQPGQLPILAEILTKDGTYKETVNKSEDLTHQALALLDSCGLRGEVGEQLRLLSHQLLQREM